MEKELFQIVFVLFFIVSILLQFLFYRKIKQENIYLRYQKEEMEEHYLEQLVTLQRYQEERLSKRIYDLESNLRKDVYEGMHQSDQSLIKLSYQLKKLDTQQQKMENISEELLMLQDILQNKSSRGVFGEMHLEQILASIFGENNKQLYAMQYRFNNGRQADAAVFAPQPLGTIAIDSKFPLENYERMLRSPDDKQYARQFEADVKKHIDDIANRYIIPGETAKEAMMFIPAEAVYAQIYAYHMPIILYAQKRSVWVVSPSTLISTLSMIQTVSVRIKQTEEIKEIEEALSKLSIEFHRYYERWGQFQNRLERFQEDANRINITSEKIYEQFKSIEAMNFDKDDN